MSSVDVPNPRAERELEAEENVQSYYSLSQVPLLNDDLEGNDCTDEVGPFEEDFRGHGCLQSISACNNRSALCDSLKPVVRGVEPFLERNRGLFLIALSQLFFALMHTFVKIFVNLNTPISPLELVCLRMALTYVCCVAYMYLKGIPDPFLGPEGVRILLVFRGLMGFCRVFGVYYSLKYLSLSDATVLTFLSPLCTALSGYYFLNESYSWKEATSGVISLVGVILIAQPQALFKHSNLQISDESEDDVAPIQRLIAVGAGLFAVLGAAGVYTIVRFIGKRAHPIHTLMYFSSSCVIFSFAGMLVTGETFHFTLDFTWIGLLLLVTVFGFYAQLFLTMGLQREAAGRGTLAIYVQIIFASSLEYLYFPSVPSTLSVIGTVIILGCAIFVAFIKRDKKTIQAQTDAESGSMTEDNLLFMKIESGLELEDLSTMGNEAGCSRSHGENL